MLLYNNKIAEASSLATDLPLLPLTEMCPGNSSSTVPTLHIMAIMELAIAMSRDHICCEKSVSGRVV